jgi:uncharacterized protein (DUF111 family)
MLSVQARPDDADRLEAILFRETPTLGVRRNAQLRRILARASHEVQTPWGRVAGKIAYLPDGSSRFAPEYEACARLASERGVALAEVTSAAVRAFRVPGGAPEP